MPRARTDTYPSTDSDTAADDSALFWNSAAVGRMRQPFFRPRVRRVYKFRRPGA